MPILETGKGSIITALHHANWNRYISHRQTHKHKQANKYIETLMCRGGAFTIMHIVYIKCKLVYSLIHYSDVGRHLFLYVQTKRYSLTENVTVVLYDYSLSLIFISLYIHQFCSTLRKTPSSKFIHRQKIILGVNHKICYEQFEEFRKSNTMWLPAK